MSGSVYAQAVDAPLRDSVVLNKNGYAVLEKTATAADVDFAMKSKLVRDAFKKRGIRKQLDASNLPAMSSVGNPSNKDR